MPKTRNKKQKTHHHNQQPATNGNDPSSLSHEEIWDDSALVRSWNDAVAEYDYYHSIHARGEDVDEVLRQAERDEEAAREKSRKEAQGHRLEAMRDSVNGTDDAADSPDEGEIEDDMLDEETADRDLAALRKRAGYDASASLNGEPALELPAEANIASTEVTEPPPLPSDSAQTNSTSSIAPAPVSATTAVIAPPSLPAPAPSTEPIANTDQALENIKMAYYWAGYYSGLYDGQRQARAQSSNQG